jgi:aminomuconate-semialdehyde/2-hydroxymuconate-6-semialdehyde dehydrogenase
MSSARTVTIAGVEVHCDHWIGGQRVAAVSGETFEDISPIDQSVIAHIARGGPADADAAVAAAKAAFPAWAATSPAERAAYLERIADLVEARVEQLGIVETTDNGALLRSQVRGLMPRVAHNFRFFAEYVRDHLHHPDFDTRDHVNHVSWDPSGVALLITPWNAPLMLETWKIAPALAAGCTVVLKPAEWSPLTASMLADITAEAGLPAGVFNVVQGIGEEVGPTLVKHPDVKRISFTGSVPTAKVIARDAAANLTPLSLELGGKSPFVVFADADLDSAVAHAIEQYDNAGQICLAGTRLLVEESIRDEFLDRFIAKASAINQGDPRDMEIGLGPNVSAEHLARVDGFVQRAKAEGMEPVIGGEPNHELNAATGGCYYRPTLFVDPVPGSEIATEEVFGPVLTLRSFATEDEAIALANDSAYGLAGVLFTGSPERAARVSAQLVAGTLWVNCFYVRDLRAPFGGARLSGMGREGGTWSFDFYCDVKNTCTNQSRWTQPV